MLDDPDSKRHSWPIGMVMEANPDRDGLVRKITVKLGNKDLDKAGRPEKRASVLQRPIQKVVLLMESH